MSAITVAWLVCDECDSASGDGSLGESETVGQARRVARGNGWHHRPDGRDICDFCWDEGKR